MLIDPLHYPRLEFSESTFREMASGFSPFRSLFGPRRSGKTQFLLQDLAPRAEQFGHRVVYLDLWDRGPAPLALMLYEFDRALQPKTTFSKLIAGAHDLAPRVTLTALKGLEVEIDLTRKPKTLPEDQVLLLQHYFEALANPKKRTLLLFDEFQEIGKSDDGQALMAALRSNMTRYAPGLAAVFTGSSAYSLKAVFNSRKAPFYNFATPLRLPPLGAGFAGFMLKHYPAQTKVPITEDDALAILNGFGGSPFYFRRWLEVRPTMPNSTHQEVADYIAALAADENGYEDIWLRYEDPHRLVLHMVARGVKSLYGDEGRGAMQALGVTTLPGPSQLQSALKTLERNGHILSWDKDRQIADPVFRDWILARPATDFQ